LHKNLFLHTSLKYSQANLITTINKRDQEAFSLLYDTYSTILFHRICDEIKTDDTAEAVFKCVFQKLWKEFPNYDQNTCRLMTWAITLTKESILEFKKAGA
jgi:DNA-directed RNA polymerase specialized sigma24 family protein